MSQIPWTSYGNPEDWGTQEQVEAIEQQATGEPKKENGFIKVIKDFFTIAKTGTNTAPPTAPVKPEKNNELIIIAVVSLAVIIGAFVFISRKK